MTLRAVKFHLLFTWFLIAPIVTFAQDFKRSVVTDPSISRRCDALITRRGQKIEHKQKLVALIYRNERLQKLTPRERRSVIKKLKKNQQHLQQELKLTLTKIQHQEETIIRRGCPGITL